MDDKTIYKNAKDLTSDFKNREPVFVVIFGSNTGKIYRIQKKNNIVIGRADTADIMLPDDGISRKHAQINIFPNGKIMISDLNSTNGTFVNGEKVDEKELTDGDKIQLGSALILKFSFQDGLEESFQENLYQSATQDSMLQIYNKKYFMDTLAKEYSYAIRNNEKLSLIMFDIDHFKKINDTYGHQAGDFVLKTLAKTIKGRTRKEDIFARYGGEEFTLILKGKSLEQAIFFAERIRNIIESTEFIFEGTKIPVTISLGVALFDAKKHTEPDKLIKDADAQLYNAKQNGRNQVGYNKEQLP